jgi:hypothetical protein
VTRAGLLYGRNEVRDVRGKSRQDGRSFQYFSRPDGPLGLALLEDVNLKWVAVQDPNHLNSGAKIILGVSKECAQGIGRGDDFG